MKPRGMLMIEHRLIEKMLQLAKSEAIGIEATGIVDPVFIEIVVDFVRTYADRTHHGKEEEILFKRLQDKTLQPDDQRQLGELIEEHYVSRHHVGELHAACERYRGGDESAVKVITAILQWLAEFYPKHIAREDKTFFPNTEKYFTNEELAELLSEFNEFDRGMIHEKYRKVVDSLTEYHPA
jgi:hemerythrin-like domain-containing protein